LNRLRSSAMPFDVNSSLWVTGSPSGTFHGSVTSTGGWFAMCADSRRPTESGRGTDRVLSLPVRSCFGGAKHNVPSTIRTCG
jgi:hypothetical protein